MMGLKPATIAVNDGTKVRGCPAVAPAPGLQMAGLDLRFGKKC